MNVHMNHLKCRVPQAAFGEKLKLVGSHEATGSWDLDDAPDMQWNGELQHHAHLL